MDASPASARLEVADRPPVQVPAGQTVLEALAQLEIRLDRPVIAVVNGQSSDLTYRLQPGDRVRLIPQIGGGLGARPP
jgi:sulfur carrier protein ThiS